MDNFVSFFEELSTIKKLAWVIGCLSFFWILEYIIPLVKFGYKKVKHASTNLVLLCTTVIINALFGLITVGIFEWINIHDFGILHLFEIPLWLEMILAVMILDFIAQYVVHYLLHRVRFMWRFHMVHHSDTHVDVTTGTRHHPGDYILRETFALIGVFLGGIPLAFYMIYRIASVLFTYFSHANIGLPNWLDNTISYIFVSPNMHKFHHHFERPWTDTNFGNIFSLWDRLFGTFIYTHTHSIRYGLDVLDDKYSDKLGYQMGIPFDYTIKTD